MSTNRSNDDLDALADRLRRLPRPPVPAGLEARLLAAAPGARGAVPASRRRWGRLWPAVALAAAAALLAVLLRFIPGKRGGTPERPDPRPAPLVTTGRPPTPENHGLSEFDPSGPGSATPGPPPYSFEWPVLLTVPVTARDLPDELTN